MMEHSRIQNHIKRLIGLGAHIQNIAFTKSHILVLNFGELHQLRGNINAKTIGLTALF